MTTPTRNTIMRLAVASACSWIALCAQAQAQVQQATTPQAVPAAAPETVPAAEPAAAAPVAPAQDAAGPAADAPTPVSNVVTVSGSRIAAFH